MREDSGYDEEARFFALREAELRERRRKEFQQQRSREEREKLQELHYMHCPKCGQVLKEVDYHEVRIDVCPFCEGMWLDKGELDVLQRKAGGVSGLFSRIFG